VVSSDLAAKAGWEPKKTRINLSMGNGSNADVWRITPGAGGSLVQAGGTQLYVSSLLKHPALGK
jgi:hypothetical protein